MMGVTKPVIKAHGSSNAKAFKNAVRQAKLCVESGAVESIDVYKRQYLGGGYEVTASMGHIRDLPQSQLGIDVEHGYAPQYINIKGKEKIIKELKSCLLYTSRCV